jgi:hypothetical protein
MIIYINKKMNSEIFLYIGCLLDRSIISCQLCFEIPEKMYRISNTKSSYCEKCVYKLLSDNIRCPITRNKIAKEDIMLNYEKNDLLDIFIKYQKIKIKNIYCNMILK